jgi:glycogen synthase
MWNPADDPFLPEGAHFSVSNPAGKQTCKRELLQQLGLPYIDPWHAPGEAAAALVL